MSSLFTKIINREIDADIVYEDDKVIAILDIFPVNPGHILVIPKHEVEDFTKNSPEDLARIMEVAQRVAQSLLELDGVEGINLISNVGKVAGQTIFHTHLHVIPRLANDGLQNWKQGEYENDEAKKSMANTLRDKLMSPQVYQDQHPTNPTPTM